ncbi:MAG: hypothetical protein E7599_00445 [Ruminococcaceae bacterium]|nr:hypothetical protein [Oscillospiraceae bacterium]
MKLDGILHREQTVYLPEEDSTLRYRMSAAWEQGRTVYCLWIALWCAGEREECFLYDIATSYAMAERIWVLFTEGLVTPITAQDILEQLLSDAAFLYADEKTSECVPIQYM